jgi:hypothetical protein
MTTPLKKSRERFFVEAAAKLMKKTWTIGPDREHPDFLVTEGAQQFRLEVCEIFTGRQGRAGSAMKKMESRGQRPVDDLRREYEATTNIPLRKARGRRVPGESGFSRSRPSCGGPCFEGGRLPSQN